MEWARLNWLKIKRYTWSLWREWTNMQLAAINGMKIKTRTKKLIVSEDRWLQMSSGLLPRTQIVVVSTHGSRSVYVGFYCPEHDAFSVHMFIELLPFHSPSERFTCVARGFVTSIPAFLLLDGPVHYLFFFVGPCRGWGLETTRSSEERKQLALDWAD